MVAGRQEGGKLGELVAYKQNHIFKDWDDVKKYANNRIDEVANLYGPGLAANMPEKRDGNLSNRVMFAGKTLMAMVLLMDTTVKVVGNIFPKVTGGFSTTLGYKNLSLYARFDYALGHTIYNDLAARSLGQYQGSFNIIKEVKNME
ncbi:hypothetical protein NXX82_22595 [Bacteroides fragilis]|nr:hypothetical protein [Bacteroides fragilis]